MRVAEDAARQSDAKWLPEVAAPVPFAESLALVRGTTCFAGALVRPAPPPLLSALLAIEDMPSDLAVFVGPEGDFSPDELAALLEVARPVSFGETVLRAETAAVYGVAVLRSWLDRADR
ncbi:MAG: RNA methyltransferase, partial [Kiritimatiellae bacterium]|nr:RNA methyltransferase [Kiritimatiellia bacterium]